MIQRRAKFQVKPTISTKSSAKNITGNVIEETASDKLQTDLSTDVLSTDVQTDFQKPESCSQNNNENNEIISSNAHNLDDQMYINGTNDSEKNTESDIRIETQRKFSIKPKFKPKIIKKALIDDNILTNGNQECLKIADNVPSTNNILEEQIHALETTDEVDTTLNDSNLCVLQIDADISDENIKEKRTVNKYARIKPNINEAVKIRSRKPSVGEEIIKNTATLINETTSEKDKKTRNENIIDKLISRKVKQRQKSRFTEISHQPIDPSKVSMADMIYLNPASNPMSQEVSTDRKLTALSNVDKVDEESVVKDDEDEDAGVVAQVKIGPDGNIILNETSMVVEEKHKTVPMLQLVDETNMVRSTHHRRGRTKMWSTDETRRFYAALSMIGTDFSFMCRLFPHRQRMDLKKKFKREEKHNRHLVEIALQERKMLDISLLAEPLSEKDESEEKSTKKKAKKLSPQQVEPILSPILQLPKSKKAAKIKKKHLYYEMSSDDEYKPPTQDNTIFTTTQQLSHEMNRRKKKRKILEDITDDFEEEDDQNLETAQQPSKETNKSKKKKKIIDDHIYAIEDDTDHEDDHVLNIEPIENSQKTSLLINSTPPPNISLNQESTLSAAQTEDILSQHDALTLLPGQRIVTIVGEDGFGEKELHFFIVAENADEATIQEQLVSFLASQSTTDENNDKSIKVESSTSVTPALLDNRLETNELKYRDECLDLEIDTFSDFKDNIDISTCTEALIKDSGKISNTIDLNELDFDECENLEKAIDNNNPRILEETILEEKKDLNFSMSDKFFNENDLNLYLSGTLPEDKKDFSIDYDNIEDISIIDDVISDETKYNKIIQDNKCLSINIFPTNFHAIKQNVLVMEDDNVRKMNQSQNYLNLTKTNPLKINYLNPTKTDQSQTNDLNLENTNQSQKNDLNPTKMPGDITLCNAEASCSISIINNSNSSFELLKSDKRLPKILSYKPNIIPPGRNQHISNKGKHAANKLHISGRNDVGVNDLVAIKNAVTDTSENGTFKFIKQDDGTLLIINETANNS